jgi:hypothetical protein
MVDVGMERRCSIPNFPKKLKKLCGWCTRIECKLYRT